MMVALIGAAGIYLLTRKPEAPPPKVEPRAFVWSVEMEELLTMEIALPFVGKSEAWIKHADKYWYFDKPDGPKVDMKRWGGGIPLLLSGPGAERVIVEEATGEQLQVFGLSEPHMIIGLSLVDGSRIDIEIGDTTPDRQSYYVKLKDSNRVYTVDYTWHDVLARLVLEPPYPPS